EDCNEGEFERSAETRQDLETGARERSQTEPRHNQPL
ncbi:uncharacterized, partial [Tachysurus ichikawai]